MTSTRYHFELTNSEEVGQHFEGAVLSIGDKWESCIHLAVLDLKVLIMAW